MVRFPIQMSMVITVPVGKTRTVRFVTMIPMAVYKKVYRSEMVHSNVKMALPVLPDIRTITVLHHIISIQVTTIHITIVPHRQLTAVQVTPIITVLPVITAVHPAVIAVTAVINRQSSKQYGISSR